MYGAILGDMIGSPYEFAVEKANERFPLFCKDSLFTDDTVMTVAIEKALMIAVKNNRDDTESYVKALVRRRMRILGRKYPDVGYGGRFERWLLDKDTKPYNSCGNGSAMRTSAVGWMYDDLDLALTVAKWVAEVTHNHPEGIKGAQAVVAAIILARNGKTKREIARYIEEKFGYNLSLSYADIRGTIDDEIVCQTTVPAALISFLDSQNFEDTIRKAVLLGGDTDTVACIAGSVAEAYYGVPEYLVRECRLRLPEDLLKVEDSFYEFLGR